MTLFPADNSIMDNASLFVQVAAIPFISCVAIYFTARTIWLNREISARNIYADYVKMGFQNCDFSFPLNFKYIFNHENKKVMLKDGDVNWHDRYEYERYEWWVSYVTVCVEGIFETVPDSSQWYECGLNQLKYHREFIDLNLGAPWLSSKVNVMRVVKNGYRPAPRGLIGERKS